MGAAVLTREILSIRELHPGIQAVPIDSAVNAISTNFSRTSVRRSNYWMKSLGGGLWSPYIARQDITYNPQLTALPKDSHAEYGPSTGWQQSYRVNKREY